jgi:hypothetical protein
MALAATTAMAVARKPLPRRICVLKDAPPPKADAPVLDGNGGSDDDDWAAWDALPDEAAASFDEATWSPERHQDEAMAAAAAAARSAMDAAERSPPADLSAQHDKLKERDDFLRAWRDVKTLLPPAQEAQTASAATTPRLTRRPQRVASTALKTPQPSSSFAAAAAARKARLMASI